MQLSRNGKPIQCQAHDGVDRCPLQAIGFKRAPDGELYHACSTHILAKDFTPYIQQPPAPVFPAAGSTGLSTAGRR